MNKRLNLYCIASRSQISFAALLFAATSPQRARDFDCYYRFITIFFFIFFDSSGKFKRLCMMQIIHNAVLLGCADLYLNFANDA